MWNEEIGMVKKKEWRHGNWIEIDRKKTTSRWIGWNVKMLFFSHKLACISRPSSCDVFDYPLNKLFRTSHNMSFTWLDMAGMKYWHDKNEHTKGMAQELDFLLGFYYSRITCNDINVRHKMLWCLFFYSFPLFPLLMWCLYQ